MPPRLTDFDREPAPIENAPTSSAEHTVLAQMALANLGTELMQQPTFQIAQRPNVVAASSTRTLDAPESGLGVDPLSPEVKTALAALGLAGAAGLAYWYLWRQ